MYASLIAAGVSQLYDLYKGVTGGSTATDTSFKPSASDDSSASSGPASSTTPGAVNSTSTSGGKLSDALHKLFTDLQSGSSAGANSTDATNTVAGDLQSVFKHVKGGGAHGHPADTAPTDGSTGSTSASNPFGGLAASLLSYSKSQGLGAASASSTSLTA